MGYEIFAETVDDGYQGDSLWEEAELLKLGDGAGAFALPIAGTGRYARVATARSNGRSRRMAKTAARSARHLR